MKVLAISSIAPGKHRDELAQVKQRGVQAVWRLIKHGLIRNVYQRRERPGVVLELEVDDGEHALKIVSQLPAIQLGILQLDELIVCDPFTSLEVLFQCNHQPN